MSVDVFLKIDGVKGESADDKHKDEIDILAWDWGMSQSGTTHTGTGGGSGKVEVRDLTVTKFVDRSSPNLMRSCCSGKHFKEALLTVRKAGGKSPVEYYKVKMQEVIVTNIESGGSGEQDRLTETVSLNFARMNVDYTPQKEDGSADAAVPFGWDIAANKEM